MANFKKVTKKDKALLLFEQNINKNKQELISLFLRELNTTEGSARTYLSWCRKELADKHQLEYKKRNIGKSSLKREKAINIFDNNPQLSRSEMVDKFVTELKMTKNSAATHCSMCSKQYKKLKKGTNHNAVV